MKLCGFDVGLHQPFFLIAGTCSIEGLEMSIEVAGRLKEACSSLGIPLIYKGSFDKANRSSGNTQRVIKVEVDCDSDCLLIQVEEDGPACHNGTESCFDTAVLGEAGSNNG